MGFTGLSEFFWFLLIFGGLFAFTMWRQQRDRRRRKERLAALSPPAPFEPVPLPAPLPAPRETMPLESTRREPAPLEAPPPETAPDISWGRGPATPVPEVAPDWSEAPRRAEAAAAPARTAATPPARRTPPAVRRPARRPAVDIRSEAGLRQAVIALTVLGPCRALEPYGGDALRPGGPLPPQRR